MSAGLAALRDIARPTRGERRRLALAVAIAVGAAAAAIALLATSGYLISRAAQRPPILMLMVAIVGVRAFGIARAALRYGERLASHDLALRQLARLRVRFYGALRPLLPGRLREGQGSGELLARFVADVDTLQDLHLRVLIPGLVAALVALGAGLAAWLALPAAGLVVLAALALASAVLPALSGALAARSGRRQAPARARLTAQLLESVDGAAELALAGRSEEHVARLRAQDAELAALGRADALAAAAATLLGGALTGAGVVALMLVAIPVVDSGALAGVLLAALVFLLLASYENVLPLPLAARRLRACATAAARLQDVCAQRAAVVDPRAPRASRGGGELRMAGVRFRYAEVEDEREDGRVDADADELDRAVIDGTAPRTGGDHGDAWVLDGVDLVLAPGERVALLGPSGAGKSTLAELLVRFYDPQAGLVTLDGLDVRELDQEDLRRAVLLCGQDAHLFNTTIRANLLIARPDAGEEEFWRVLRAVELDEWVAELPDALDTFVGQDGGLVSGGQRRRLALARALLSPARFLILDEPTAHLDAPLAARVMAGVRDAAGERAVLAITHDATLLEGFDRVVALRTARVVVSDDRESAVAA
ncbi:MAG TPA: ATP-binding cassette domain-containing protein [Solirubrobacteraceae bacterium]|jgi:ABC-type transport system involved in cytochrome bd biosynthesis fused ATPase/permease subunit|nr:ATP-binding cassette domain-containing protein [Solirubrobacteraceae bacterium]